jgi:threonylcarbamoyladenosine tRNA methylthiotransferase MtaB
MRRWYRAEDYARRAEMVRESLPDAAIGADVIAGFPGETDTDHHTTLALLERLPLSYLHVFSFSPRPGTRAAEMQERVPGAEVARRARELRALGEKKKMAFYAAQVGRTMRVLTLKGGGQNAEGPWTRAVSGNYLDLRVRGRWPANQMLRGRIEGAPGGKLISSYVNDNEQEKRDSSSSAVADSSE